MEMPHLPFLKRAHGPTHWSEAEVLFSKPSEFGHIELKKMRISLPCLIYRYANCYMFPSLEPGDEGGAVGLLIPSSVGHHQRDILESLLQELTSALR